MTADPFQPPDELFAALAEMRRKQLEAASRSLEQAVADAIEEKHRRQHPVRVVEDFPPGRGLYKLVDAATGVALQTAITFGEPTLTMKESKKLWDEWRRNHRRG